MKTTENDPLRDKSDDFGFASSDNEDKPRHPPSLISIQCPYE